MKKIIVSAKNLSKKYPGKDGHHGIHVLENINLTIHEGEFLALLGPSGSGKSTLLRILAGFDKETAGIVTYSPDLDPADVNFVFQDFGLLPWLSVFKNVELGFIGRNIPEHERIRYVNAILDKLGLHGYQDHRPHDLSGGMKQRVGLARAFVTKPKIIFLDEPFSELDFFTAHTLRDVLLSMWQDEGTTVVMVSHYIEEAVSLADRIAVFSNKPATIIKVFDNPLERPRNVRTPGFYEQEDRVIEEFTRLNIR